MIKKAKNSALSIESETGFFQQLLTEKAGIPYILRLVMTMLLIVPWTALFGQAGVQFSLSTIFDGNAFKNYEEIPDLINQPQLTLYYSFPWSKGTVNAVYDGTGYIFREYEARQYLSHSLGLTGTFSSKPEAPVVSWGVMTGRRINGAEYTYYDYRSLDGYLNWRSERPGFSAFVLGIRYASREYSQLPEFSYRNTSALLRYNLYLPARTSLFLLLQAGRKSYFDQSFDAAAAAEREWPGRGEGRGRGKNSTGDDGPVSPDSRDVTLVSPGSSVVQLSGSIRISQSLGTKTGLAAEYGLQRNPSGTSRVLSGQDSGYETDDDLYDDPYSYHMDEITCEINRILPWKSTIQIGAGFKQKRYERPVYDAAGELVEGVTRQDDVSSLWLRLEKNVPMRRVFTRLSFWAGWMVIGNRSNDVYYDYTNSITGLGMTVHR